MTAYLIWYFDYEWTTLSYIYLDKDLAEKKLKELIESEDDDNYVIREQEISTI